MANGITLNQLESHLWEAANILRGPVDAAAFKTYVFPLLFFKRLRLYQSVLLTPRAFARASQTKMRNS